MRILTDTLIALMLVGILAGFLVGNRTHQEDRKIREYVRTEVHRFQQQIQMQAAMNQALRDHRAFPETVDVAWFATGVPQNTLLPPGHPWVEIAPESQADLLHPNDRIALNNKKAQFWYNPANGCLRARVPPGVSDDVSLELYNFVNECSVEDLFSEVRRPVTAIPKR